MKKLWVITALVICYFFSSTAVLAQELGEFCWKQKNSQCTLKLNATQHNSFFSFVGNEICPGGEFSDGLSHVSGSGFISDNQVNIGLYFISIFNIDPAISITIPSELIGAINLSDLSIIAVYDDNALLFLQQVNYASAVCDS